MGSTMWGDWAAGSDESALPLSPPASDILRPPTSTCSYTTEPRGVVDVKLEANDGSKGPPSGPQALPGARPPPAAVENLPAAKPAATAAVSATTSTATAARTSTRPARTKTVPSQFAVKPDSPQASPRGNKRKSAQTNQSVSNSNPNQNCTAPGGGKCVRGTRGVRGAATSQAVEAPNTGSATVVGGGAAGKIATCNKKQKKKGGVGEVEGGGKTKGGTGGGLTEAEFASTLMSLSNGDGHLQELDRTVCLCVCACVHACVRALRACVHTNAERKSTPHTFGVETPFWMYFWSCSRRHLRPCQTAIQIFQTYQPIRRQTQSCSTRNTAGSSKIGDHFLNACVFIHMFSHSSWRDLNTRQTV